jgi:hypothetical protein
MSGYSGEHLDLGSTYHTLRIQTARKLRNHIAQLTAMGYPLALEPAPKHTPAQPPRSVSSAGCFAC